jgi:uncharacterized protein
MEPVAPHASHGDDEQARVTVPADAAESDGLGRLRRWEQSGAVWQVLRRTADGVEIALLTCDAGEQVGRVRSAEADLIAWIGDRERSDEPAPAGTAEPDPDGPMGRVTAVAEPDGRVSGGRDRPVRDRDAAGRARNARPRDGLGRPLPPGAPGVPTTPDDLSLAPAAALAEAQRLLDEGMPFHAHEVLEASWKAAPDDERELWRGLAQLAVGLTHVRRGNDVGAPRLLRRAADRIEDYAIDPPHHIAVRELAAWARALAGRVEHVGGAGLPPAASVPRLTK